MLLDDFSIIKCYASSSSSSSSSSGGGGGGVSTGTVPHSVTAFIFCNLSRLPCNFSNSMVWEGK